MPSSEILSAEGATLLAHPLGWIPSRADMSFGTFAVSGTQYLAYSQPAAEDDDAFVVEIVTPFTKTLPGTITLDVGTVASPNAYIANFDLTQAAGTFGSSTAVSLAAGLNSLTVATDIKAKVTYAPGVLTAGEFLLHVRCGQLK